MCIAQRLSLLVCAVVLAMACPLLAAQGDIAKFADPKVEVSQLMEGGGSVIVSSLNVLPNNDLLAVVIASREQAAAIGVQAVGQGVVLGRVSKDSGKTWGPASLVLDAPADGSRTAVDPTTIVAGNQVIVIVPMSSPAMAPFDYGDLRLWQITSNDNGATWSKPGEIRIPRARPCTSGRQGIVLGDGTILVPYWWDFMFQVGSSTMAVIGDIPCVSGTMISKDRGATWDLSTDVYGQWSERPKVLRPADEPAIVALSDKEIFMVLRSAREDGLVEETWSHDGGRTWELAQPSKLTAFNTPSALWRLKNGGVVRMWNNSKTSRYPLAVAVSTDGCRTWSEPRTVVQFPDASKWPVQASYPVVVEAPDGMLVAVWCHVTPEGKWLWACGRFTLDWASGK